MTLLKHWPKLVTALAAATTLRQAIVTFAPVLPSWFSWALSWTVLAVLVVAMILAVGVWLSWRLFAGIVRRAIGGRRKA